MELNRIERLMGAVAPSAGRSRAGPDVRFVESSSRSVEGNWRRSMNEVCFLIDLAKRWKEISDGEVVSSNQARSFFGGSYHVRSVSDSFWSDRSSGLDGGGELSGLYMG